MENLYPYYHKDLTTLIMEFSNIQSFVFFSLYSYYEIKLCNKYLYVAISETGLFFVIEAPKRRTIKSKSRFYEEHFHFKRTDKIWLKYSLDSEMLGDQNSILIKVNENDFKKKYGLSYCELKDRLTIYPYIQKNS